MKDWPSIRARELLKILNKIGWTEIRSSGSHKVLRRQGWADFVFAFRDSDEVGPRMVARIAKQTGLAVDYFRR